MNFTKLKVRYKKVRIQMLDYYIKRVWDQNEQKIKVCESKCKELKFEKDIFSNFEV